MSDQEYKEAMEGFVAFGIWFAFIVVCTGILIYIGQ